MFKEVWIYLNKKRLSEIENGCVCRDCIHHQYLQSSFFSLKIKISRLFNYR